MHCVIAMVPPQSKMVLAPSLYWRIGGPAAAAMINLFCIAIQYGNEIEAKSAAQQAPRDHEVVSIRK
jgi:hypothetical protein